MTNDDLRRAARLPFAAPLLVFGLLVGGCDSAPPAQESEPPLQAMIDSSLTRAVEQYRAMDEALPDTLFPRTVDSSGTLRTNTSRWWTSGFFPGSLWYLYEHTGDPDLRARAEARTWAVEREKLNAADHDIGFKILNSFGHAWRLTGDSAYVPVIMTAARTLTSRFDPRVGAIRSWGEHPDTTSPYLVIVDNMMNLELLFWAAEHSGDSSFFDIAVSHADRTLEHHYRPDGSSWHVLEYDPVTGDVLRKRTQQGHADSSAWARGQAWGLYGFVMAFRETGFQRYLEQANRIADFILTHLNLPDDGVPYWDFDAPGIPDALRDASAAAITASALLELSDYVENPRRTAYRGYAETTLRTLSGPAYRAEPGRNGNFLLRHSVGSLPGESEVDVPLSYADYYYIEGLMRLRDRSVGTDATATVNPVGTGWARSAVNAVIFRQHGLVSRGNTQFVAFYEPGGRVVLARRGPGEDAWETHHTPYTGDVADAHNAISIAVDGGGTLHLAWDQHDDPLRYARSTAPGSLDLTDPLPMTGAHEGHVTYPQFYHLPDGDLLFAYRDGSSGRGDVMLNRYDRTAGEWTVLAHPLVAGEGERNAYINQLAVDRSGGWHVSWTWRETWDVATNHDILYAYSPDQGTTWRTSTGEEYRMPITAAAAEVATRIPQGSGLINQTTMAVDADGRPHIATYWTSEGSGVPQLRLVWHDGSRWRTGVIGHRTRAFQLAGGGTRRIPVSRPLVLVAPDGAVYVVFRDLERGGGISVAVSTDPQRDDWRVRELYRPAVGMWEPVHDPTAWAERGELHLLVQRVGQGQGETLEAIPPQPVKVLEWDARPLEKLAGD